MNVIDVVEALYPSMQIKCLSQGVSGVMLTFKRSVSTMDRVRAIAVFTYVGH